MRRNFSARAVFVNLAVASAFVLSGALVSQAQPAAARGRSGATAEQRTASHFESLRRSPPQQFAFLRQKA